MRELELEKVRVLVPENKTVAGGIFKSEGSGALNWNKILYPKFYNVFKQLLANFWKPEDVSMVNDLKDWKTVPEEIQDVFLTISVMLSTLDSMQSKGVFNLFNYITDTATQHILINIAQQETIHTQCYSYINSDLVSGEEQDKLYNELLMNENILSRNIPIGEAYDTFMNNSTPENLLKFLVNSTNLEGIYFVSAFVFFYALDRKNKMKGSSTMISYIHRDEMVHFDFIGGLVRILMTEYPELNTKENVEYIYNTVDTAVEAEIDWAYSIFTDEVLDYLDVDMEEYEAYIRYLANKRLRIMGLENYYDNVDENPMPWIKTFDEGSLNNTRTDQFEAKPRTYAKVGVDNGFDEL